MGGKVHTFKAVAFEQNFSLKDLARKLDRPRPTTYELCVEVDGGGHAFFYPFGAVVFWNADLEARERELERLRRIVPGLTVQVVTEDLAVVEDPEGDSGVHDGTLTIDRMTRGRASTCALTVGQSCAMEYYERIVDSLQQRTSALVERLETKGTTRVNTRPLHRFIGEAISVRTEVLTVLHLLDKPDATWDDPVMDAIYRDLREDYDLGDRYDALESKLRSVQEALELVLDVARDFRLVVLEASIVVLIVFEIVIGFIRH